jgi:CMP/dCMP kinase
MKELFWQLQKKYSIEFENDPVDENSYTRVKLDGRDVTDLIRNEEVGSAVSIVSKLSGVRKYLVRLQREIAAGGNAVLEGRDTGSVVCPDAFLKSLPDC